MTTSDHPDGNQVDETVDGPAAPDSTEPGQSSFGDGPDPAKHIAVALSGGGHRAALFALGAVMYLVDAGKGQELAAISSVSGGSLTNAWLGLETDLASIDNETFRRRASQLARKIALGGTLWASWLTYVVLAVLAAIVAAAVMATIVGGAAVGWIAWLLAILAFGIVAKQRGRVARYSFDRALFCRRQLKVMHNKVNHVLCAADLQTAEHVYFSADFVYTYRTGKGIPADLSVSTAAQASAALPGAFPPVSLPLAPHRFPETPVFGDDDGNGKKKPGKMTRFLLTDGGAYDNMASEWVLRLTRGFKDGGGWANEADEAVLVNSSAGKGVRRQRSVRLPVVGEIMTLLAANDVLYDQSTAVRRRLLNLMYQVANLAPDRLPRHAVRGTTIQIDRSPFDLPTTFARFEDEAGTRAKAVLSLLEHSADSGGDAEAEWDEIAKKNAKVKTTLSRIPLDRAASLLRHAYVLTMVNTHVNLGYPLLEIPSVEESEQWLG